LSANKKTSPLPEHLRQGPNKNGFSFAWRVREQEKSPEALTLIVRCMDYRFRVCDQAFIEMQLGIKNFDLIGLPGADLSLSLGMKGKLTKVILSSIDTSIRLHKIKGIIVLGHWDCGGYPAYDEDDAEADAHEQSLVKALKFLRGKYPKLKVSGAYSRLFEEGQVLYYKLKCNS
jgi:hypothetical protein